MCTQTIDQRAPTPASPCKNCGLDVGLYPSMHKCQQQQQQPNLYFSPLPPLPTRRLSGTSNPLQVPRKPIHSPDRRSYSHLASTSSSSASSSSSSFHFTSPSPALSDTTTASPSPSSGKWSRFSQKSNKQQQQYSSGGDSIYWNNFAAHLPEQEKKGKGLWSKVRQAQQGDIQKPGGKLWGKLRLAAQNMADKIPSHDDKGPESDESDWEGETHVSRILREYYVKKQRPSPRWLHDDLGTPNTEINHHHQRQRGSHGTTSYMSSPSQTNSRGRLWDQQQQPSIPERNFSYAQSHRDYQSNTNDTFKNYNAPAIPQPRNRNRHNDDDDEVRRKYSDSNYQRQHRRDSNYQISPRLSHDMDQERRFSMNHARQRQHWDAGDGDGDGGWPATFHHDRLHGPRLRPSKHNHH